MAVNGTHNVGEEWKQKTLYRQDTIGTRETALEIRLYNDGSQTLSDSSDPAIPLSSEPTTGNYAPQTLSLDSTSLSLSQSTGDLLVQGTVTFDVLDTGETVDGFVGVVSFQSDVVNAETGANPHVVISGTFGTEDLSNYSSFDVTVQDTLN